MSNFVSLDTIYAASLDQLRGVLGNMDSEFLNPYAMQVIGNSERINNLYCVCIELD